MKKQDKKDFESLKQARAIMMNFIDHDNKRVKESKNCLRIICAIIEQYNKELSSHLEYMRKQLSQCQNKATHIKIHYMNNEEVKKIEVNNNLEDYQILNIWFNYQGKYRTLLNYICDIVQYFINGLEDGEQQNKIDWVYNYLQYNDEYLMIYQIIIEARALTSVSKKKFYQKSELGYIQLTQNLQQKILADIVQIDEEINELTTEQEFEKDILDQLIEEEENLKKEMRSRFSKLKKQ